MIQKSNIDEIQDYFSDASNYKGSCSLVYFPETVKDVAGILKEANRNSAKVTIAGNRTGLTGGAVPEGGIVISTSKMNSVIELNKEEKFAVVQPGVLLRDFQNLCGENDLLYPPDPTERDSFIGGNCASNASGARTFKYGPTRDYIIEIELVLPDGEILHLKRNEIFESRGQLKLITDSKKIISIDIPEIPVPKSTKHVAGYFLKKGMDAVDLFIGAEGTLGIITSVKLKLLNKPENVFSAVAFFPSENDGLNFIIDAKNKSRSSDCNLIDARALEYFDSNSLELLKNAGPKISAGSSSAVWFEQEMNDTNDTNSEEIIEEWINLLEFHNCNLEKVWLAQDENDTEKIKSFRHALPEKVNEIMAANNLLKVGTDTAVPDEKFLEYYNFCTKLVKENNLRYCVYGHVGNSHIHLNMLPANDNEYNLSKGIYDEMCKKAVEFEGTISAEHGIGKLKRQYFYNMFGKENILKMARIKKTIDPNLILNIGSLFYEETFTELD